MEEFDETIVKKMDALLGAVSEMEKYGNTDDELAVEDLDKVTGGVTVPGFQQFLQYARERRAKETEK